MLTISEKGRNLTPQAFASETENIFLLNEALGEVDLTKNEETALLWLAGWERGLVKAIISAFEKAHNVKK